MRGNICVHRFNRVLFLMARWRSDQRPPDGGIITAEEARLRREVGGPGVVAVEDAPVVHEDGCPGGAVLLGVGVGGEGGGPGDVAVAGGVQRVATFGEDPAGAGVDFAESEEIGGDVLFGAGEAFLATES